MVQEASAAVGAPGSQIMTALLWWCRTRTLPDEGRIEFSQEEVVG